MGLLALTAQSSSKKDHRLCEEILFVHRETRQIQPLLDGVFYSYYTYERMVV